MVSGIDDNELEQEVKNILDNGDNDITVELSNLSESVYGRLKNKFSEYYQVKGTVNILRISEPENIGKKDYTLHINKRYEDA
ncbi:MAG: hypothetical protein IIB81_04000 [Nanoarchaeota archaeon]|nr:hypothetical protein [Nanoarchaeota archaeon]